jgi:Tfp pilus assembly protein PilX
MRAPLHLASRPSAAAQSRGFVLPLVLIMLVLMTTLVVFMVRRGTIDERLAGNVRAAVTAGAAADRVLRYCELWVRMSRPGFQQRSGLPKPPETMDAPKSDKTAAWRVQKNWDDESVEIEPDAIGGNVSSGKCLIEDATSELLQTNTAMKDPLNPSPSPLTLGIVRKYRITAVAEVNAAGGIRNARAQSELRVSLAEGG